MTDSPTTQDESAQEPVVEEQPKETGKGLRTQLEKALEENRKLKADQLAGAFGTIGLDPTTGLGKAIAKEYDGDATPEALSAYASSEYGWTRPEPQHPQAQQIVTEQARVDQVAQVTVPATSAMTEAQAIAEAEAAGDFDRAGAIKAAQMQRLVNRNQLL